MPPGKRRKFTRPQGKRRYRKIFVLATEGSKTTVYRLVENILKIQYEDIVPD